jgi:hypothetical protein
LGCSKIPAPTAAGSATRSSSLTDAPADPRACLEVG